MTAGQKRVCAVDGCREPAKGRSPRCEVHVAEHRRWLDHQKYLVRKRLRWKSKNNQSEQEVAR